MSDRDETVARLIHERTLLAEAVVKIARASGAVVAGDQPLTGPQLLLLADDVIQEMEARDER